ncbi:ATP-binding protein [Streptomyces formicae]|uniref:ATP-binding protein n=1 Tax=Streptomyces formicae TaxID=1616117 RepID=UPI0024128FA7|nr:ATP-binding protein [Streptomyces formicae]
MRHAYAPPASPRSRRSGYSTSVTHLRGLTRQQLSHPGTLDFITGRENIVILGPPSTGKTHLAIYLGVRAARPAPRRVRHSR